jgi:hypothetical protein
LKGQDLKICVTFDVDFTDYLSDEGSNCDEFGNILPLIFSVFEAHEGFKTTWFIRLDSQMEAVYGKPDYISCKYQRELQHLALTGHEMGWHPHFYVRKENRWKQNCETRQIMDELMRYAPMARSYGMKSVRMGWGFHTNETMRLLADICFLIDSSAIPRPRYSWEKITKDWTRTPVDPYYPSELDYRIPGRPSLRVLEIPMSVAVVRAPYDTGGVIRYMNLAYHPDLLREPLKNWFRMHSHLITVTHPYELSPRGRTHGLLAFDLNAFEQNLQMIQDIAAKKGKRVSFLTLSEFATLYGGGHDGSVRPANY